MTTPTTRTEPRPGNVRGAFRATPSGAPKSVPTGPPPKPKPAAPAPPKAQSTPAPKQQNLKTTIEEVEDEDDASVISKKKKKKKPKKKKKAPTADAVLAEVSPPPSVASPPTSPAKPAKIPSAYSSSFASSTSSFQVVDSTSSVKSGRSYMQEREPEKQKVKSRPDHASIFSKDHEKTRKGIFSKFLSEKEPEPEPPKESKSIFSKISTKAKSCMQQLFVRGDQRSTMKWDNFVKV